MSTEKKLLALALVQALLVVVTWQRPDATPRGYDQLIDASESDIETVTLSSAESSLTLARSAEGEWSLPEAGDYPVQASAAEALVETLLGIQVSDTPIATNPISHLALNVAESDFGRRLRVQSSAGEVAFWVGRSDTGGLNVRPDNEDAVSSGRGASLADLSVDAGTYVERAFVALEAASMESIFVRNAQGEISLSRVGEEWVPDVTPAGREPAADAVDAFVSAVTSVNLSEPSAEGRFPASETVRVVWMQSAEDGEPSEGWFEIGAESESYRFVRRDDSEHVVLVSTASLQPILDASPLTLTEVPSSDSP